MRRASIGEVLCGLAMAVVFAASTACINTAGPEATATPAGAEAASTTRPTATVKRGSIVETVRLIGRIAAAREADLYFERAGRLKKMNVKTGDDVAEGALIAEIDTGDLDQRIATAQSNLDAAEAALRLAVEQVRAKEMQRQSDIASAKIAVEKAEADLLDAKAKVEAAKAGPSLQEQARTAVREAEYALAEAQRNLIVVQKSPVVSRAPYDRMMEHNWYEVNYGQQLELYNQGKIDKAELEKHWQNLMAAKERLDSARAEAASALATAEEAVAKAEDNLRKARAELAGKEALPPDTHIKEAERGATLAQITLDKARADYELKLTASNDGEVELKEAQVAQAKANLEELLAQQRGSVLVAPFAGKVIAARGRIGDQLSAFQPVAIIADPSSLIIRGDLMDADIPKVALDQSVGVTIDALAGASLKGKVVGIPSRLTSAEGGVDRSLEIAVELPRQAQLGMLARLSVEVQRKDNVLIVPLKAIKTVGKRQFVEYMEGDLRRSANVEVGVTTDAEAEIISGLREGQVILAGQ